MARYMSEDQRIVASPVVVDDVKETEGARDRPAERHGRVFVCVQAYLYPSYDMVSMLVYSILNEV